MHKWKSKESICKDNGEFQIHTMDILLRYGKEKELLEYMERELNYSNTPKEVYYRAGEFYGYLRMYDKMRDISKYLTEKYPDDFFGFSILGDYYFRTNNWKLAHKMYILSLSKNNGENANNYLCLISTSYFLHDYKNSCMCFEKATVLDPLLTVFSKGHLSDAVKSFIHIGNLTAAKSIIDNQLKFDKGIEEYKGFQEALKMYEDAVKNN